MAIDLTTAQTHLDAWVAADLAVSKGQAYTIGNRSLTKADAATIREQIEWWQSKVNILTAQGAAGVNDYAYANPGVKLATFR